MPCSNCSNCPANGEFSSLQDTNTVQSPCHRCSSIYVTALQRTKFDKIYTADYDRKARAAYNMPTFDYYVTQPEANGIPPGRN